MLKLLIAATAAIFLSAGSVFGAQAANEAMVRVVHASPDAPAVDIYANGARVLSNVAFRGASDYLQVPAGNYTFEVRPAGAPATSAAALTASADLQPNTAYTVMAVDRLSQIKARVFVDNIAAPAAGKAHVQVVHASPDAPAVDIAVKGGQVLVPNLPFGEQRGPIPVDAGSYNLEVRLAGTSTVALPLDGLRLEAGKIYTVTAVGLAQGQPALSALPLVYSPPTMTPPHSGDAGLLELRNTDGTDSYLSWVAVVTLVTMSSLFAMRLASVRTKR